MPANQSTPEATRVPIRIALEDVTPTIAAAFGDDLCLIWSGEWQSYWRAGGNGYTKDAAEAGWYTIQAAYVRTRHCDPSKQIAFERTDATPARGGDELREAANAISHVLNREGMPEEGWSALMMEAAQAAAPFLASTDMAGAGEIEQLREVARMVVEASDLAGFSGTLGDAARAALAAPPVEGLTSGEGKTPREILEAMQQDRSTEAGRAAYRLLRRIEGDQVSSYTEREDWIAILADLAASPKATATASVWEDRYLVWSNEHKAWWGVDHRGYTRFIDRAGRYDRAEALKIAGTRDGGWRLNKGNPDEIAIPEQDAIDQYADITAAQALTDSGTVATIGGERA